jgi:hypothetical protein
LTFFLISLSLYIFTICSNYSDFLKRHLHLRNRLLDQGYTKIRLIRSLKKFIFRYQDLVKIYSVSAETIISNAFSYNGGLNRILKRQTSRSHYGSKVPAVSITVFKYRNKIGKIVVNNYEFRLSLCKIVRSSVILLLPLFS